MQKIVYTKTDEAPALATYSFFPIIEAFLRQVGVELELKDISLASRILAQFSDSLPTEQQVEDALSGLADLVHQEAANIIKLPNISATTPQIQMAVKELQSKQYNIPDYPEDPQNDREREISRKYNMVKGSAVNPVIREGNSDRRAAAAVKNYARKHPHTMGEWSANSKSHVSSMNSGDFYENEKSITIKRDSLLKIVHENSQGERTVLRSNIAVRCGDIVDGTWMNVSKLKQFIEAEIIDAKNQNVLFSLHLKATMMKVSDPIIFGHVLSVFFKDVFETYKQELSSINFNPRHGLSDLYSKISQLTAEKQREIKEAITRHLENTAELAMVNSNKGITNLHVPNDVIIDASMPAALRSSGKMWGKDGQLYDMKAVIPDRSYSQIYQEVISFCKQNGALDPSQLGAVSNVGLMARKAEEYGSHNKTFEISSAGNVYIQNEQDEVLLDFTVNKHDIFRACHVDNEAIQDWMQLGARRSLSAPAIFWLDSERAHDREVIKQVHSFLEQVPEINARIMSPRQAMRYTLETIQKGGDIVSVTGNVLRDYLTDLFPILELGTSAKMLSIIPLMKGGFLAETGAGGSAPKHVQQFLQEGHLRWDSLGEFLALAESLEFSANKEQNSKVLIMAEALNRAVDRLLQENKNPQRKVNTLDNRGSHVYLAKFWAEELVSQIQYADLATRFKQFAETLNEYEESILNEINETQGTSQNLGGYFLLDNELAERAMRPSKVFNAAVESLCKDGM